MGKITIGAEGSFETTVNKGAFFSLKDHGQKAEVIILSDQPDGSDLDYHVVHAVTIDGRFIDIDCKAVGDDGQLHTENCVLCQNGFRRSEKLYLQLWNEEAQELQVWSRGKSFVQRIVGYLERYGSLVTRPFEIVRNGARGDKGTTYEFFPLDAEPENQLSDFPERVEIIGRFVKDFTTEEMQQVVDGEYHFPAKNEGKQASGFTPRRRGSF